MPNRARPVAGHRAFLKPAMYASSHSSALRLCVGNPYLGLRLGGGSINGEGAFAYAADVGVEIVHHPRFLLDLTGRAMGMDEALGLEATWFGRLSETADMREGTRAFLEKRKAVFPGS